MVVKKFLKKKKIKEDKNTKTKHNQTHIPPPEVFPIGERKTVEFNLVMQNVSGWYEVLSHTVIDNVVGGSGWQYFSGSDGLERIFQYYDSEFKFDKNYRHSLDGDERAEFDATQTYLKLERGEEWQWSILAGYNEQELVGGKDVDFSPAPVVYAFVHPASSEVSQLEVQVTSPQFDGWFGMDSLFGWNPGTTEFTAGVLGFQSKTLANTDFFLDGPLFLTITGLSTVAAVPPCLSDLVNCALIGLNPDVAANIARDVITIAKAL